MASAADCSICDDINQQGLNCKPPKLSSTGKLVLGIGATIAAVIYGIAIPFVLPGFRKICLPFIPATDQQIGNILRCLKGRSGSIVDLGSGDGRIILSVMKANMAGNSGFKLTKADGVELNSWLVLYSKFSTWRHRNVIAKDSVSFYKRDIFKTNMNLYDNIVVFGVDSLMIELESKLNSDLKENSLVLACRFPLPNWKPIHIEGDGIDKVWVYDRRSNNLDTPV